MNHRNGKYARIYLKRMQRAFEDSSLMVDDLCLRWHEAWQRHDADMRSYCYRRNNFFGISLYGRTRASHALPFFTSTGLSHPRNGTAPLWSSSSTRRKPMREVLATIADHRYLGPLALAS